MSIYLTKAERVQLARDVHPLFQTRGVPGNHAIALGLSVITRQEQAIPTKRRMDDAAMARFIAHYERLTRYILAEMPGRADCVISLDEMRDVVSIRQGLGD